VNEHGVQGFKASWELLAKIFTRNDLCFRKGHSKAGPGKYEAAVEKRNTAFIFQDTIYYVTHSTMHTLILQFM
jgi:hypothetical protein